MHSITLVMLLFLTEAKRFVSRKKKMLPAGIVLIVFIIGTFSYVKGSGSNVQEQKYITLGVSNQDSSEYAALLLSYFKDNQEFSKYVELKEGEESVLKGCFDQGGLDCLIVIPEGFAKKMIQMEHLPVHVSVSTEDATKALLLKTVLQGYETYIAAVEVNCAALYAKMQEDGFSYQELQQTNVDISLDLIFTALGKDSFFARRSVEPKEELPMAASYLLGACCLLLLLCYFPAGSRLREYFGNGMAWRVRLMGVSYAMLSAAMLAPYLLFTLLASGVLLIFAPEKTIVFFFMELLFLLPLLLFPAVLGMACKKKQTYLLLYSLSFIGMALLGGAILPELYLPEQFLLVTKWLPNYRFVRLFAAEVGRELLFEAGIVAAETIALWCLLLFFMKRRGGEAVRAE